MEIGLDLRLIQSQKSNLGPVIEVANTEEIAVFRAFNSINSCNPSTFYFFVDSQAAILRIKGGKSEYS